MILEYLSKYIFFPFVCDAACLIHLAMVMVMVMAMVMVMVMVMVMAMVMVMVIIDEEIKGGK